MSRPGLEDTVVPHQVGDVLNGRILRRIVAVDLVLYTHPPMRQLTLNCGHQINVERGLRPHVGKLTPCPWCK